MANGLLKGKRGIISGALNDQSIAWKVAELAHAEGATIILTNAPVAMRMGEINKLAEAIGATFYEFDVEPMVAAYTAAVATAIGRPLDWSHDDIALQNIQARGRSPGICGNSGTLQQRHPATAAP